MCRKCPLRWPFTSRCAGGSLCFLSVLSVEYLLCNLLCEVPAALHSWSETWTKGKPKEKCQGQGRGTLVCFALPLYPSFFWEEKGKVEIGWEQSFLSFLQINYSNTHGVRNRIFGCTFAEFSDIFPNFLLLQSKLFLRKAFQLCRN